MTKLTIFTDGAIHDHGMIGGWACVILREGKPALALADCELNTTSNRMELSGVIQALEWVMEEYPDEQVEIDLTSDSQYVVYGASKWMEGWKENNWHKVKNLDLWLKIYEFNKKFKINWHWEHGHAGATWNTVCDTLAGLQCRGDKLLYIE